MERMTDRALSFDVVAGQYDSARPGYPPALFDAVEELSGRPLHGSRVLDVGAGTGIATRQLLARGAEVTAVEPGPGMAAQLRRTLPDTPLVRGFGDALPIADTSVDLVTYAQSWHWTDPALSLPEALRVLRPGGALALWWNVADPDVPWVAAQDERLRRRGGGGAHGVGGHRAEGLPDELPRVRRALTVPLDSHLANLSSHSLFRVLGGDATAACLAEERAELLKVFPTGSVEEAYTVDLIVTLRPAASSGTRGPSSEV
ncbi:class I SAM-dependent methyltransferase [Streptomyces sp. NPDC050428]|uniref:class I SAM-dependent methyltransferase n=1 Tax=Streptomyces sp. NPDC050428 TaxID=3155757 RepID=UPI0034238152